MAYKNLRVETHPPVARVRLTRPIDDAVLQELDTACEAISGNDAVVVTLISGEPGAFTGSGSPALNELACPVIVALQGEVNRAGLALALAADLRVAAGDATFDLADVDTGALAGVVGYEAAQRLQGRLDASEALRAGLVSRLFAPGRLADEAEALATLVAGRGPIALRYVKEAVRNGLGMNLDQALRYELDLSVILQTTEDRAEGVRAFLEKREPRFKGR